MKYIDMHCDTLMEACLAGREDVFDFPDAMVDVRGLKEGDCMAQFFAVFMPDAGLWERFKREPIPDEEYMQICEKIYRNSLSKYPEYLAQALDYESLCKNKSEGKISAFLTMEDGRPVNGSMEKLEEFYQKGYRLISLTWNDKNCFGNPNSRDRKIMESGLTSFGIEAVQRMNELGMLVDVSHLSDGGFYDVVKYSRKPFAASHSNCRALCEHPRNLTDEMLRTLGECGGVAGLNFYPGFLDDRDGNEDSKIEKMAAHLRHMISCGGIDCAAIGTDFDGIDGKLEIGRASAMQTLFEYLEKQGFTQSEIEKIAYKNVERVIKEVL